MRKLIPLVVALAFSAPALASFSSGNDDLYGWAAHRSAQSGSVSAVQPGIGDRATSSVHSSPRSAAEYRNADQYGSVLYDAGHRGF